MPASVVGAALVAATAAVFLRSLRAARTDVRETLLFANNAATQQSKGFCKGDFILHDPSTGERSSMESITFSLQFELAGPTDDATLAAEGFKTFQSSTKLWARQLSATDVTNFFPRGRYTSSTGVPVAVKEGDYLTVPFPSGGELQVVSKTAFSQKYKSAFDAERGQASLAEYIPTQGDVLRQWERKLQNEGLVYIQTVKMHAKRTALGDSQGEDPNEHDSFILCDNMGNRSRLRSSDFHARYQTARPLPAIDTSLGAEGFQLFSPTPKVWAHELSTQDVETHFRRGCFYDKYGETVLVCATDILVIPFPSGQEVDVVKKMLFGTMYKLHLSKDYVPSHAAALAHWEGVIRGEDKVFCETTTVIAKVALHDEDQPLPVEGETVQPNELSIELTSIASLAAIAEGGRDDDEIYDPAEQNLVGGVDPQQSCFGVEVLCVPQDEASLPTK